MESPQKHFPLQGMSDIDRLIYEIKRMPLKSQTQQLLQAVIELGRGPIYIGHREELAIHCGICRDRVTIWSKNAAAETGFFSHVKVGTSVRWEIDAMKVIDRIIEPTGERRLDDDDGDHLPPPSPKGPSSPSPTSSPSINHDLRREVRTILCGVMMVIGAIAAIIWLLLRSIGYASATKVKVITDAHGQRMWDFADERPTTPPTPAIHKRPINVSHAIEQPPIADTFLPPSRREKNRNEVRTSEGSNFNYVMPQEFTSASLGDALEVHNLRMAIIEEHGPIVQGCNIESESGRQKFHAWAIHARNSRKSYSKVGLFVSGLQGKNKNAKNQEPWHARVTEAQMKAAQKEIIALDNGESDFIDAPRAKPDRQLDDYQMRELAAADFKRKMGIRS